MADYIIQKAVNMDAVKKSHQHTLEYYADNYEAQDKNDGCCSVIYLMPDGSIDCRSRTNEVYPSMDNVASDLASALEDDVAHYRGLVLLGEAWWPGKDQFSTISGEFRRHKESDRLEFVLNDVLTLEEFNQGWSTVPYSERANRLSDNFLPARAYWTTRRKPGSYGDPQALCNELVAKGGYDGLMLVDPNGTWTAGRGTTGEKVKLKQVLSFDLTVLEIHTVAGAKTGRPVHKLIVDFGGKRLGVGSGVPHCIKDCPRVGDIVEVEAMGRSSEGLLREPRFKSIRFDKLVPDTILAS